MGLKRSQCNVMELYEVRAEDKKCVNAVFGVDDEEVERRLEALREWCKNKPDLPGQDEQFLSIMLLRAKFRDDYAKTNIENYFRTVRLYPEIFEKLGRFKLGDEAGVAVASPKITADWERIGICKMLPKNLEKKNFDVNRMIVVTVTTGMIMFSNDYVAGVRFLLDFDGFTVRDLFKVNVKDLFKLVAITENMLRIRISGIELYNAPRFVRALLGIARLLLKPKIFSRVSVHHDLSSLHENIPKECLPSDYGGEAESTEKLVEIWESIIDSHRPFFDDLVEKNKSGETNP